MAAAFERINTTADLLAPHKHYILCGETILATTTGIIKNPRGSRFAPDAHKWDPTPVLRCSIPGSVQRALFPRTIYVVYDLCKK